MSSNNKYKHFKKFLKTNSLLFFTLLGVVLGVLLGTQLQSLQLSKDAILLMSYPGELFMRILKLLILPLIIASLVYGSASLNAKLNGKIALRTLTIFVSTSMFNAILGICLVSIIHPGNPGMSEGLDVVVQKKKISNIMDNFLDVGRNIFPDNIFEATLRQTYTAYEPIEGFNALTNSSWNSTSTDHLKRVLKHRPGLNTLGLAVFCLVFGAVLGTLGSKGRVVTEFFSVIFEVIMKIVTGVMWLTPIGVASIIAGKILIVDNLALVLSQLGWFIFTVCLGVFFHQFVILPTLYYIFVRKNPFKFYCGLIQGTLTASVTASTAAALPITFRLMTDKLHIDARVCRFVLPIGCNINMDGTALFIASATIFISQMSGMVLGFGDLCTVFLTSTIASMSASSVPSSALVLILVTLAAIDAPTDNVSLLFTIDWLVDRVRTTNNMLGDCYTTAIVEQLSQDELSQLPPADDIIKSPSDIEDGGKSKC